MENQFESYVASLTEVFATHSWDKVAVLAQAMFNAWQDRQQLFLCGNGGSAANAIHLANDFLYGIAKDISGPGMRVEALTANSSVLSCLANDVDYSEIFSEQLVAKADENDLLIVLSGSGNSPNVVRALETANKIGMKTFAIVGYTGGKCRELAQVPIHLSINDMQISEDIQLIVGHMCMRWLSLKVRRQGPTNQ